VVLGTDHVRAVIANTKSGHFRPPPSAGDVVRARCRSLFGLADSDIDVFTLFGDAVAA